MIEYFLNGAAAVWHLPDPDYESGHQLRIIPRAWITNSDFDTAYSLSSITVKSIGNAPAVKIPATDFTFFKYYHPGQPGGFISPVSSLKQILSEQIQADRFRSKIWRSSGRFNAYISRPKDVVAWDDETRKKWIQAFREGWGSGGSNEGKIPLLEDGMEIKPYQFNAKEAQYAETKQLSREDVAAAYHVNPSLIWHTNTQTFASAKDNARALYSDCLGPTLQMLQQRINTFLLPMLGADPNTYVEFDLTEKLKGSFEERASMLQSAVGGPYMTRNEARADSNLPPVDGGDQLIVPLNVNNGIDNPAVGEEAPKMRYISKKSAESTHIKGKADDEESEALGAVIEKFFKRQAKSIIPKIGAGKEWWDENRWNNELSEDIDPVIFEIATKHGTEIAEELGTEYYSGKTVNYLKALAEGRAKAINSATKKKLDDVIESDPEDLEEEIEHVYEVREDKDADLLGMTIATTAACWAIGEACAQAKDQGYSAEVFKTWVTGENPREDHAMMDGETVPVDQRFSNGADWPGDDILGPDGTCGCNCTTEITITRR
jgi:HK97 family phage portal protein